MEENGMPDERDTYLELGLPQNLYIPGALLYYNDDLKFEEQEMLNSENNWKNACVLITQSMKINCPDKTYFVRNKQKYSRAEKQ